MWRWIRGVLFLCLVVGMLGPGVPAALAEEAAGVVELDVGGEWRFVADIEEPPPGWTEPAFDDSEWSLGRGGPGHGGVGAEVAPGATLHLRRSFVVLDPGRVTGLTLEMGSDGPFTAFLNGIEIIRSPQPLPYHVDAATGQKRGFDIDLGGIVHELLPGANVLAIEVVNLGTAGVSFVVAPGLRLVMKGDRRPSHVPQTGPALSPGTSGLRPRMASAGARFVILLVCDGWGPLHIEAANQYAGLTPGYQLDPRWSNLWMSTFPAGGGYDGVLAWSDFAYPLHGTTDSAAAATAMFAGRKTRNGRIGVDAGATTRLDSLGERARTLGMAVGAVTTVQVSHATPGAYTSHNLYRSNTYAIADEAFFGDPNTTGTTATDPRYGGGFGPTLPATAVIVGSRGASYVHSLQRDKLFVESGLPGKHTLVEGAAGVDGAAALLDAAADPACTMLAGLFDRVNLRATVPGHQLETPSLADSTAAALAVLERNRVGFALMIEGGAVDWAAHANDMDWTIGELLDLDEAVATVVDWIDDPSNLSSWSNTLVVITGDHETGYLTPAPGVFPDRPLDPGSVNKATLALEKVDLGSGRRASWIDDNPANDRIDPGETVYWAWNTSGHSNILIPVFARGVGSERLYELAVGADPVRGPYIDNTSVFKLVDAVLDADATIFADGFESGDISRWGVGR